MADLSQLETALRNADAAGDTQAAQILAAEITKARGSQGSGVADFVKSMPRGAVSNIASAASFAGESPVPPPEALLASTEEKQAALDNAMGLHKPETRAGRFGEAIGAGLGNPL